METLIGKIESVSFGLGGYQDAQLGIGFTLSGKGWGVCDFRGYWDQKMIAQSANCKWSEADRDKEYAETMRYVSKLLSDAKRDTVDRLKGKPIEANFDRNVLKSWRILTEAI